MATTPDTLTAEPALVLTPPEAVPVVTAARASGLVPVDDAKKSELDARVDGFVTELVAQDVNSPEFGRRVDAITAMGSKEIRAAAGQSNRFLDRPVRAMDKETGVGADLAELRRTIEKLDPGKQGKLSGPRKILGIIPFGGKLNNYFDSYKSSQTHISSILKSLASARRAADGQCRDRYRAVEPVDRDGPAGTDDPSDPDDGRRSWKRTSNELDATDPAKRRRCARRHCSTPGSAARTC